MAESGLKALCELYVRRTRLIGALYCIMPTVAWFTFEMMRVPFREVYLLRLALALVVGGYVAARVNEYGVNLWMTKHRSKDGPCTLKDGALIGAAVGIGIVFLPPLTSLISSHHVQEAKLFIIVVWACGIINGAIIGALLGSIGVRHLSATDSGSAPSAGPSQAAGESKL